MVAYLDAQDVAVTVLSKPLWSVCRDAGGFDSAAKSLRNKMVVGDGGPLRQRGS